MRDFINFIKIRSWRRAAAAAAAFLLLVSICGCSGEDVAGLLEAAADAYDKYGPGSVVMASDDTLYEYRHAFYHTAWQGEAFLDLKSAGFLLQDIRHPEDYSDPVFEPASFDKPGSVTVYLSSAGPDLDPADLDGVLSDPPGWNQAEYPGAVQDGLLYRRCLLLPERFGGGAVSENMFTGTAFLYFNLCDAVSEIGAYLDSHPDGPGVLYNVRLFYDAGSLVPEGVYIRAYAADGSFELARYVHNIQPGIFINYSDGSSRFEAAPDLDADTSPGSE